jgi:DNA-binding NarL/FixJ family response regulator
MNEDHGKKTIAVCDTQPITAQGLRNLLASSEDLELMETLNSLETAAVFVREKTPDIVVVDKGWHASGPGLDPRSQDDQCITCSHGLGCIHD